MKGLLLTLHISSVNVVCARLADIVSLATNSNASMTDQLQWRNRRDIGNV